MPEFRRIHYSSKLGLPGKLNNYGARGWENDGTKTEKRGWIRSWWTYFPFIALIPLILH